MWETFLFWYARKSSESDEKQVQSIESQLSWIQWSSWSNFSKVKIFHENKSAKDPYKREEFQKMLDEIEKLNTKHKNKEDFKIIIYAWWLDRLSRNPVDSWLLQYFLQIWKIHEIICSDRVFTRIDSWIMMGLFNALNNQFIMDLQKNTKRWMKDKADKGWCIQLTPNWYINNKLTKEADVDKKLKPIIIEIFRLRDEWYSLHSLVAHCNKNWYKTKKWRNFTKTVIDEMLKNPFYIWFQKNEGVLKKANHEVFIDVELWERINNIKRWYSRKKAELFPLKWIIKSYKTKKNLLAVQKFKWNKKSEIKKEYIYYCTHNTDNDRVSISQEQIIKYFDEIIYLYEVKSEIKPIIADIVKKDFLKEFKDLEEQKKSINLYLSKAEQKVERLFELVCDWTIENSKYKEENNKLVLEIEKYQKQLKDIWRKNLKLNEDSLYFVELLENLTMKRKVWSSSKKMGFIKILIVELFVTEKKELILQENKLFEFIKYFNLLTF